MEQPELTMKFLTVLGARLILPEPSQECPKNNIKQISTELEEGVKIFQEGFEGGGSTTFTVLPHFQQKRPSTKNRV